MSHIFQKLVDKKIIGKQIAPDFEISIQNKDKLIDWIRGNHFTVYHWACTCHSGVNGRVADEHFRLKLGPGLIGVEEQKSAGVISNLFVGSAACLPELSEANPHLTVTSFAIALAEELARSHASNNNLKFVEPRELTIARSQLHEKRIGNNSDHYGNGVASLESPLYCTTVRREGEEFPSMLKFAERYAMDFEIEHQIEKI